MKFLRLYCGIKVLSIAFSCAICVAVFFISLNGWSAASMNGVSATEFGDFSKSWKLVTVRFRNDTHEMRFTYANDLAWESLRSNSVDYPDGAVFAKVGLGTQGDPAFPSSVVPGGARRVQYMVRDHKKYASSGGWGYALFNSGGEIFSGDSKSVTAACVACHQLVKDRGFVFSQPMDERLPGKSLIATWREQIKFQSIERASVSTVLLAKIPPKFHKLRLLGGPMAQNSFFGTVDELIPLLISEAVRTSAPVAFMAKNQQGFALAFPDPKAGCASDEIGILIQKSTPNPSLPVSSYQTCEKRK